MKVGVDVGGTFTDFLVADDAGEIQVGKVLSTPEDPSIGLLHGLEELARERGQSLRDFASGVSTIVHGTTVTTNVVLTGAGAKTGLLTTEGVRDALEMRRGIREQQYNNRYTNVPPLVARYLRRPVRGRLDYAGREIEPLAVEDVAEAIELLANEKAEAIAICFMNSFANAEHEQRAAEMVRDRLPDTYVSVSTEVLPSIRFYPRVSTTVLNAYVGPVLSRYLDSLTTRLSEIGFCGVLLIMQSNGGVVAPQVARDHAAVTLLSGPAAGPSAGLAFAEQHQIRDCLTVDMGGTSFDAALIRDGQALTITEGQVNRYSLALPMLDIVTIGAGGGSIGWLDEGGLLRVGPRSAGADPGPACYGKGGSEPTVTDADLALRRLDPAFFAGGRMPLDERAAARAIGSKIAEPLGLSVAEAAAGLARVVDANMAAGVREVTIRRGYDPREFPMVVAGGAGPNHACAIATELELPLFIVPRDSSIFCAAGMLMTDLKHDVVKSRIARLGELTREELLAEAEALARRGRATLLEQNIPEERIRIDIEAELRYVRQYHEVALPLLPLDDLEDRFHDEHLRVYGYALAEEKTPLELINLRARAIGVTEKPKLRAESYDGADPSGAAKGERSVWVPEDADFRPLPVFDGHRLRHGHHFRGPAVVEQLNTTLFVSASFDLIVDPLGSFFVYRRGREDSLPESLRRRLP
ncbi:MAG: hydantoinase/oxoprolinase family protein [Acidobacteriota bacterium]|nr:MAG: hydantoinase/oxoprolinase family protein [Acidobacteriota bacterium]